MSKAEMVTLLMTVMRDNHGFSKLGAKNSKDFQFYSHFHSKYVTIGPKLSERILDKTSGQDGKPS